MSRNDGCRPGPLGAERDGIGGASYAYFWRDGKQIGKKVGRAIERQGQGWINFWTKTKRVLFGGDPSVAASCGQQRPSETLVFREFVGLELPIRGGSLRPG